MPLQFEATLQRGADVTFIDPVLQSYARAFHVLGADRLLSFPPTSTGAFTSHVLTGAIDGARQFFPNATTMFVTGPRGPAEVDASFATIRELPYSTLFASGAMGASFVRFTSDSLNAETRTPGRVDLVRENVWTTEVAVNSPVHFVDTCDVGF